MLSTSRQDFHHAGKRLVVHHLRQQPLFVSWLLFVSCFVCWNHQYGESGWMVAASSYSVASTMKVAMGQTVQDALQGLEKVGEITLQQSADIESYLLLQAQQEERDVDLDSHGEGMGLAKTALINYLEEQTAADAMTEQTSYYIQNVLNLNLMHNSDKDANMETTTLKTLTEATEEEPRHNLPPLNLRQGSKTTTSSAAAAAGSASPSRRRRTTKNIVRRVGNWVAPETVHNGDRLHNGIWGYYEPTTQREYALVCSSDGFHIVDIGTSSSSSTTTIPRRVQYIPMAGGDIWRDAATHRDENTGITYAYVAGQNNADLWIVNLAALSFPPSDNNNATAETPSEPPLFAEDSNPIPSTEYKMVSGYNDDGHTLHCQDGMLFLNTARRGDGIRILDVQNDPWNPRLMAEYTGGDGHDCTYMPQQGLLISADGYQSFWTVVNINRVRQAFWDNGGQQVINLRNENSEDWQVGRTNVLSGAYAHSNTLTEDGQYMYIFDEFNLLDMAIYDMQNPAQPVFEKEFSWLYADRYGSNALVHNGHVRGNLLHVAYYGAGYRVYDITNRTQPVEVGSYDTLQAGPHRRQDLLNTYMGAWNAYVHLPSQRVLVSDMLRGLYVFAITEEP